MKIVYFIYSLTTVLLSLYILLLFIVCTNITRANSLYVKIYLAINPFLILMMTVWFGIRILRHKNGIMLSFYLCNAAQLLSHSWPSWVSQKTKLPPVWGGQRSPSWAPPHPSLPLLWLRSGPESDCPPPLSPEAEPERGRRDGWT